MATDNEIKFIFTGDTSDYDKAVDDVVGKANKTKIAEEKTNSARKTATKLQKLLVEEYKDAAKAGGSVAEIEEKIKKTEQERLAITKQLNKETLTTGQRQKLILDRAKSEARIKGFRTAKFGAGKKAVGDVGGQAASIMGMGGMPGAAFSAMSAGISIPMIAAFATVGAALAGLAAAAVGTTKAMEEGLALRKEAQKAGKTVEKLQAEKFAEAYGGNAEEIGAALKAFGVIIDDDLNKRLAESSKKIKIVGEQIWVQLIPIFTKLAEVTAQVVGAMGGAVAGLRAAVPSFGQLLSGVAVTAMNPIIGGAMVAGAVAEADFSKFGPAFEKFIQSLNNLSSLPFMEEKKGEGAQGAQITADSLSRIGIFKGQRDSELQTLRASLIVQRGIQTNTNGMIGAIENA